MDVLKAQMYGERILTAIMGNDPLARVDPMDALAALSCTMIVFLRTISPEEQARVIYTLLTHLEDNDDLHEDSAVAGSA